MVTRKLPRIVFRRKLNQQSANARDELKIIMDSFEFPFRSISHHVLLKSTCEITNHSPVVLVPSVFPLWIKPFPFNTVFVSIIAR